MRLTTRQGVQFHVVHKGSCTSGAASTALLTTLAACGDVVRNMMGCPWPDERQAVRPSRWWTPSSPGSGRAPRVLGAVGRRRQGRVDRRRRRGCLSRSPPGRTRSPEPIYGDVYFPRKFKSPSPGRRQQRRPALQRRRPRPTLARRAHRRGDRLHGARRRRPGDAPRPRGRHLPAARRGAGVVTPGAGGRRRRGDRHDAAGHRRPRGSPAPGSSTSSTSGASNGARGGRPAGRLRHRPAGRTAAVAARGVPGTRDGASGCRCRRAKSPTATASSCAPALRSLVADGTVTQLRVTPARTCCCTASSRNGSARSRTGCGPRRRARRRRRRAPPAGHRLPGAADVRPGLGEAERAARTGDELEKVLADGGHGDCRSGEHDRLPERLRPSVQGRDRHRRADGTTSTSTWRVADGRAPGRADPRRRAAGPDRRRTRAGASPGTPTAPAPGAFGDWATGVGADHRDVAARARRGAAAARPGRRGTGVGIVTGSTPACRPALARAAPRVRSSEPDPAIPSC